MKKYSTASNGDSDCKLNRPILSEAQWKTAFATPSRLRCESVYLGESSLYLPHTPGGTKHQIKAMIHSQLCNASLLDLEYNLSFNLTS